MLMVLLKSSLFSLLTDLHNRMSSAELFGTNLWPRVTLPFHFPNDLTNIAVRAEKQRSSFYPLLPKSTSSPAMKTKDNGTKMKMKLEFR